MAIWLDGPGRVPTLDVGSLKGGAGVTAVAGVYDGISARLAARAGFEALYLSGAALSASKALPDLGLLTMEDVLHAAKVVVRTSGLPVIVDCDTGFGEALNVMQTVREFEAAGVACIQLEDQQLPKKCGHLNDKRLISTEDMCNKVAAAKRAARDLKICARTDAASTSLDEAISRAKAYAGAGADIIFVEALTTVDDMRRVRADVPAPLLANMTEFGRTPAISLDRWGEMGFELVIYPVSAFRVAAKSMEDFYGSLKNRGEVSEFLPKMMTRRELYERIGYYDYEQLDAQIVATVLPDAEPASS